MDTNQKNNWGEYFYSDESLQFAATNPGNLDENHFHESPDDDSINKSYGFTSPDKRRDENDDEDDQDDAQLNDENDYSDIESQDDDFHDNTQRRPYPTDE